MRFFLRMGAGFRSVDPISVSVDRNLLFPQVAPSLPLAPCPAVVSISPGSKCCSLPDREPSPCHLVGHLGSMLWDVFCQGMSDLVILEISIFGSSLALNRAIHDRLLPRCVFPVPIVFLSGCLGHSVLFLFKCRALGFPVKFLVVFRIGTHNV